MHGLLWQEPDLCDSHIEAFIAAHRGAVAPAGR
jgi:hypothetical protein